ncbi:unnamed protein product [Adineta steineri]|uniref:ZP domain-containing protein n=1 Tax=Adineta steineri TaxID=433720 RepID=A0A814BS71_9BILA|nr:unnamed protein product [Adineta steineri]CAF1350878.1 unnamed protein product [Adineta steineri]CAF1570162.1 unnamed protein product [Adineta steineri]CAF3999495.1 unnamed protein product [Adineta steineri]
MKILLVFLFISSSEQLVCIFRNNFQFSTNPFDAEKFKTDVNSSQPFRTQIQKCRVELTFDYNKQFLRVAFHPERPTPGNDKLGRPRFVTTFSLDSSVSTNESVLIYTCSKTEACDRDFVLNLSPWQLYHNYSQLQIEMADILIKKNNGPVRCIVKSSEQKLEQCETEMCRLQIDARNNTSTYHGQCVGDKKASANVEITSISDGQLFVFKHRVHYICMYDECNNAITVNKVLNAILHLYNVSKMFTNENIENQPSSSDQILSNTTEEIMPLGNTTKAIMPLGNTTKAIMPLGNTTMLIRTLVFNNLDQTTTGPNNTAMVNSQTVFKTVMIVLFVVLSYFNP